MGIDQQQKPTIVSLHGIRTRGPWQEALSLALTSEGLAYDPWKYGFFKALSLVNPLARQKQINWFLERYTRLRQRTSGPISIVAHSFGTYVLAEALDQYPSIKFDKLILCGSIVPVDYDWSKVILDRKQASAVLNQYGKKDIWVRAAQWVVQDAGPSGFVGFSDTAEGRVHQQGNTKYGHSQYFFDLNYSDNWIPFLLGADPQAVVPLRSRQGNWRFATVVLVLGVGVAAAGYQGWRMIKGPETAVATTQGTPPVADGGSTQGPMPATAPGGAVVPPPPVADPVIVVTSDAPCSFSVDGGPATLLEPFNLQRFTVSSGKHEVSCTNNDLPDAPFTETITIRDGQQAFSIYMADRIAARKEAYEKSTREYVDSQWGKLKGVWSEDSSDSNELGTSGCRRVVRTITTLRLESLYADHTVRGAYAEGIKTSARHNPSNQNASQESCNSLVNEDSEISAITELTSADVSVQLDPKSPGVFEATLNVNDCTINGEKCAAEGFGEQAPVDVELVGDGSKLILDDTTLTKE